MAKKFISKATIQESSHNILTFGLSFLFLIAMISTYQHTRNPLIFLDNNILQYFIYIASYCFVLIYILSLHAFIRKKHLLIFVICFLLTFILFFIRHNKKISMFFRILGILPFFFVFNPIDARPILKRHLFYLILLFSIVYSFLGGLKFQSSRFIFNSSDPNFSAIYLLLGFMICNKLGYKIKYVFLLMGILTFSRNFLLGILVFYFIKHIKKLKLFSDLLMHLHPFFVLIVIQIVLLALNAWFLSSVEIKIGRESTYSSLNDTSNQLRFIANMDALNYLISGGKDAFINGAGDIYWDKTGSSSSVSARPMHNSFLGEYVRLGIIYGLINCIVLFSFVKQHYREENYEYVYTYLVVSLFLGSLFGNVFLYCWCYILIVKGRV